jgi:hypothetical protein
MGIPSGVSPSVIPSTKEISVVVVVAGPVGLGISPGYGV